jgi:TRAP-type C4-dicarboxylate transport system permease small subunit
VPSTAVAAARGGEAPLQPTLRATVRAARHLKWPALDGLERLLMAVCALALLAFTVSELADVCFRTIRRPWLDAGEFEIGFFVWGVFLGMGVAVRRDQHFRLTAVGRSLRGTKRLLLETFNRLVVLAASGCMIVYGYLNYLTGFGNFLMPSLTPIAALYAAIPVGGALCALFTVEELVNGWRHGFETPAAPVDEAADAAAAAAAAASAQLPVT